MNLKSFRCLVVLFTLSLLSTQLSAQSLSELSYQAFIENIRKYHPVSKMADLKLEEGEAEILYSKGVLDPFLSAEWDEKNLKNIEYYKEYRAMFRVPTILGIDVVGGYENTDGQFLNPEDEISDMGLWNLGVEVNLIQGLITNERRVMIDKAKEYQNLASFERDILINDLIYEASLSYQDWQYYYYIDEVYLENIELAEIYFQGTRESYFNGEKTAMDTLEAFIQLQDAQNLQLKNESSLIKAKQNLENYLWFEGIPLELQPDIIPESFKNEIISASFDSSLFLTEHHPLIQAAVSKLNILQIEQKLKREKLKPKLKVKYNPLLATTNTSIAPRYSSGDFKWGLNFSYPIFQRSERGDIKLGEVKLQENRLELENKRNELINKIQSNYMQIRVYREQLDIQSMNADNYERLLEGERELFRLGESSVFLLNKRQEKYVESQLKLIEAFVNTFQNRIEILYWMNRLI